MKKFNHNNYVSRPSWEVNSENFDRNNKSKKDKFFRIPGKGVKKQASNAFLAVASATAVFDEMMKTLMTLSLIHVQLLNSMSLFNTPNLKDMSKSDIRAPITKEHN